MKCTICALALFLLIGASPTLNATPITWGLDNVIFDDGGAAIGSFVYDDDLGVFSNIAITTTPGAMPGSIYGQVHAPLTLPGGQLATVPFLMPDLTGSPLLVLGFTVPLTNAGGVVPLFSAPAEGFCTDPACLIAPPIRGILSGQVVAIPEPATFGLAGFALLGLATMRFRRR